MTFAFEANFRTRSMGLKLLLVCGLALVMTIPALFVFGLVAERTSRVKEVAAEIGALAGGPQTLLGPTLVIPYPNLPTAAGSLQPNGPYIVFPSTASAKLKIATEERRRSLFRVPVFRADLDLGSSFDLKGLTAPVPGVELDWSRAEIVVGVSNPRGALRDATISIDGKDHTLTPADVSRYPCEGGVQGKSADLVFLSAPAGAIVKPETQFQVRANLHFSGAQRIAVLAYGKTTNVGMEGDWPSPGFDGGFLPANRNVTPGGFQADWSVPFIARGVRADGPCSSIGGLAATSLGVSFTDPADPYRSVSRSIKYALLFIGLIFLSFFVFEVTASKRAHPAQYVLVGIAQIIFYLLLLSIAERVGFDAAFLIAGTATVALLSINVRWVFASRVQGFRALAIFSLLYSLIYLLLRLEDNALLIGAVASFLAISVVMYLTRGIDWYGQPPAESPAADAVQKVS